MHPITAIVMIGSGGLGTIEQMVAATRLAAATDLILSLSRLPTIERILVAAPASVQGQLNLPNLSYLEFDLDSEGIPFHFGERLAGLVKAHALDRILYLGAGSAPLLTTEQLAYSVTRLSEAQSPFAITNNVHSGDWAGFYPAQSIQDIARWLTRDNMLAWRLRETLGFEVESLAPTAASRVDIDTPFDLQLLALHPHSPVHVRAYLETILPTLNLERIQRAAKILHTPGSRVTLIGRVSAAAWQALEGRQVWTRVLSEERGMVASRRQAEGRVFSIVADYIGRVGEAEFVSRLAQTSNLVLFDTRVYMAHHQSWPPHEERYASDLGQVAMVNDDRLKRLVEAVESAPIPILLGGHNVVSGGVYGLLEI